MSHIGAHSRSLERIERLCRSVDEARALRTQVLDELRRVVGFQAHAWIFTDPQTAVGIAPVADVPWIAELPGHIRMR